MREWIKKSAPVRAPNVLDMRRRQFLKLGALAGIAGLAPFAVEAKPDAGMVERRLSFYNTHTGERLSTLYRVHDAYIPQALTEINHILRDHRNDEICSMDERLLDLLHNIQTTLRTDEPLHVISGFRSQESNAMLAKRGNGVAKRSLHLQGEAIDIRVPGRDLAQVRKVALALQGGGVGYYPRSDFVHVDVGRVRYW
ncbi:MAG: DUF882 domain-containing protein [Gammaproteobacteria bacterium]|nr:DUF882 domain-containing protein [Gammaproteobacteria bacterium]